MQPATLSSTHHQYACVRCRSRKVKCDRVIAGCANCAGVGDKCIYSARRSRKGQKSHQVFTTTRPIFPSEAGTPGVQNVDSSKRIGGICDGDNSTCVKEEQEQAGGEDDVIIPRELRDSSFEARLDLRGTAHGRLFTTQGKSRYIDSGKLKQV